MGKNTKMNDENKIIHWVRSHIATVVVPGAVIIVGIAVTVMVLMRASEEKTTEPNTVERNTISGEPDMMATVRETTVYVNLEQVGDSIYSGLGSILKSSNYVAVAYYVSVTDCDGNEVVLDEPERLTVLWGKGIENYEGAAYNVFLVDLSDNSVTEIANVHNSTEVTFEVTQTGYYALVRYNDTIETNKKDVYFEHTSEGLSQTKEETTENTETVENIETTGSSSEETEEKSTSAQTKASLQTTSSAQTQTTVSAQTQTAASQNTSEDARNPATTEVVTSVTEETTETRPYENYTYDEESGKVVLGPEYGTENLTWGTFTASLWNPLSGDPRPDYTVYKEIVYTFSGDKFYFYDVYAGTFCSENLIVHVENISEKDAYIQGYHGVEKFSEYENLSLDLGGVFYGDYHVTVIFKDATYYFEQGGYGHTTRNGEIIDR